MKMNYRTPVTPAKPGQGVRPPGNLGTLPPPPAAPVWAGGAPFPVPAAWWGWLALCFAALGGTVVLLDRADTAAEAARYCARVHAGHVPDWKMAYRELCSPDGTPRQVKGQAAR